LTASEAACSNASFRWTTGAAAKPTAEAFRLPGGSLPKPGKTEGQNPSAGVVIHYHLKDKPAKDAPIALEIRENDGKLIRRFTTKAEGADGKPGKGMGRAAAAKLGEACKGPAPGTYQARLVLGKENRSVTFEVKPDPRTSATTEDFDAQFRFLLAARDKLTETHRAIKQMRDMREQVANISKRLKNRKDAGKVRAAADALAKKLTAIEETLYQTKAQSSQDVLNFPIRLNNKLASLAGAAGMGDNRPPIKSSNWEAFSPPRLTPSWRSCTPSRAKIFLVSMTCWWP
jgi:hypothetical protein